MKESFSILFGLLGGLAIFIYGMNLMSEGLQKVAGEKMRQVLGILTKNVFFGVVAGAITTMVLQSSSATTVMVIGFVSAGLMNLPQAISVILGANIGTTMTAQLIAFKLSDYIWPILFFGFLLNFVPKNERTKNIGLTIFAFGLLFVGIETMGDLMKPLAKSPVFVSMISQVSHIPILGVLVGALMTVVVQSSSATIAVLQNFASTPGPDGIMSIIGLKGSIPVLLGDNIGTTITALLACIGQSKNAKRTAVAHSVFNIVGALIFIFLVTPFANFVTLISPKGPELEVISRQIANAHTSFNIINTVIWMPFVWLMVKIVTTIIPEGEVEELEEKTAAIYLDPHLLSQPVFAMTLCQQEVLQSCETILTSLKETKLAIIPFDQDNSSEVREVWRTQRDLQREIQHYLSRMIAVGTPTEAQTNAITELLLVSSGLERICIQMGNFIDEMIELENKDLSFSDNGERELRHSLEAIIELFKASLEVLKDGDDVSIVMVIALRERLIDMEKEMQDNHLERLNSGVCNPKMTPYFNSILGDLTNIGTYCLDICQSLSYGLNVSVEDR
ncbi:MAG: Na/Pi cotransporter family protein [Sphaerochaetaceae bacterium]|nr:Na/Pi cotransporter family protein [Sphaerochaetaceae bacterium]MDC7237439.1 Na/Pi cotransporter family protein [Sphaerochaetaceae bacterium]MDC7249883.1 Na/Pi cotransporter family protein [Sphaerochaetaceae bacterium]